jgi:hypothetical protein
MASSAYYEWLRAGRPYTLIRPAAAVQRNLRAHGLTVYDYPDDSHLQASTPQDHTPFSATGYPGANKRWNARGLDVMPRSDSYAHRKENADIARQLIRDRDAGVPGVMWIKYINWTDENGVCRQERWTSADPMRRTTVSSSDRGHIHISGRSDADTDTRADGYDPYARLQQGGSTVTLTLDTEHIDSTGRKVALGTCIAEAHDRNRRADAALARLEAQAAADATRDAAMVAAITALASDEPEAVIAVIREEAGRTRTLVEQLQAENAALRTQLAALPGLTAAAMRDLVSNPELDLSDEQIEAALRRVFADAAAA